MRPLASCVAALAVWTLSAAICGAEDGGRLRYYLHLRGQDTNPATKVHDHWGVSLGANLERNWGFELSADTFERKVKEGGRTFGEYGVVALVPQVRLRYPLFGDRPVPYVVAGAGVAFTQFNDRKSRTPPEPEAAITGTERTLPVGTLGAGIEYYFADNLAASVEVKYLFAGETTFSIDGVRHSQPVASLFTTVGLRLLIPELRPSTRSPDASGSARLYLGFRVGSAVSIDTDAFSNAEIRPEPPAYFSSGNQFWGAALGMDVGRYLGGELAAEAYEVVLASPDRVSLTEQALLHVIPQLRVRYPLMNGRLVPYGIGGVGLSYAEINDRKRGGKGVEVKSSDFGIAAAMGVGVEYFVASNIAAGLETRYVTDRDHTLRVAGRKASGHYDAVTVAFTLRVFLARFPFLQ